MKKLTRLLPVILTGIVAMWILSTLRKGSESGFHTREFGRLPVLLNGRVQPFDSVARNSLLQIRRKQSVVLPGGREMSAMEWLLEVMMKSEAANGRKVFRVDHPELISLLKLPLNEKHFSFNELKPSLMEIENQAKRISGIDDKNRSPFEKRVMELYQGLTLFNRLKNSLEPEGVEDFAAQLELYQKTLQPGVAAVRAQQAGEAYSHEAFDRLLELLGHYDFVAKVAYPLIIPPLEPEKSRDAWENIGTSLMETVKTGELHPAVSRYAAMASAYQQGRADVFNRAVADYHQWLATKLAPEVNKGARESFYNFFQAFYKAMSIYVFALLLACGALLAYALWPGASEGLRRSAFYLIALAWVVHTFGLIFRMALEGRPPVTNLYSSAIFIGWGAVALGLVLERLFRVGIGILVASCAGFTTLVIAHNLALGGDTMEMLRAVLDTNFWLATHVVVVTLGYASTFVAGLLGILYILLGLFTPVLAQRLTATGAAAISAVTGVAGGPHAGIRAAKQLSAQVGKSDTGKLLGKMVYGIVCFATLFSFVGTILGGIWADQSWGRFWGWDPKENGALLIVIWNATILHARWGGMIKERGLMNLAVFGNIVTSFSWFGVNMLGIGLHAYGFMDQAFKWLVAFVASQILIIALGLLPIRFWQSFRPPPASPPTKGDTTQPLSAPA